jgi:carbon starvation protein
VQIPIAIIIGTLLHRKGFGLFLPSLIALAVMYLTVIYGNNGALGNFNAALAAWPLWQWVLVLLGYSYVASVLPVWTLLQPRDYINSLQLISALALIVVGLGVAAFFGYTPTGGEKQTLSMVAPMWDFSPKNAPLIFPFLFITIACGAISGFHCLVSSGTSSKQLKNEEDARFVGYGSMLTEGFLATLVILACGAGLGLGMMHEGTMLTGTEAWTAQYGDWLAAGALAAKVGAFVQGSANFLQALGIAPAVAVALMGVLVASFAGTTLDTACRLQRYVVQELAATLGGKVGESKTPPIAPLAWLQNKHGATIFAIVIAGAMAAVPPAGNAWSLANAGKGGLLLWPLFGATNQLLAGLSFLVITFYLWRRGRAIWFIVIPMIFMLIMPVWAMTYQLWEAPGWLLTAREGIPDHKPNYLLGSIGLATIALEIWMIVEAVKIFPKAKGVLEENALDQQSESASAKA